MIYVIIFCIQKNSGVIHTQYIIPPFLLFVNMIFLIIP